MSCPSCKKIMLCIHVKYFIVRIQVTKTVDKIEHLLCLVVKGVHMSTQYWPQGMPQHHKYAVRLDQLMS